MIIRKQLNCSLHLSGILIGFTFKLNKSLNLNQKLKLYVKFEPKINFVNLKKPHIDFIYLKKV